MAGENMNEKKYPKTGNKRERKNQEDVVVSMIESSELFLFKKEKSEDWREGRTNSNKKKI